MMALEVLTWFVLGLGCLTDLYMFTLLVWPPEGRNTVSTVPLVGAFFYVLAARFRRTFELPEIWGLAGSLLLAHILGHFVVVPFVAQKRLRRGRP